VDDMNMPAVDTYGTQQPIAMLKLLVDRGGCYDRGKDLNWKTMKDIDYVAAMGKPGGGRNEVSQLIYHTNSKLQLSRFINGCV